ncbi:hypothetical protein K501DRAFT_267983 [Backusella circina FSU 941]|nr:hypothetical protein K501DRAFT_267983 [Backusella circina FSU 941]
MIECLPPHAIALTKAGEEVVNPGVNFFENELRFAYGYLDKLYELFSFRYNRAKLPVYTEKPISDTNSEVVDQKGSKVKYTVVQSLNFIFIQRKEEKLPYWTNLLQRDNVLFRIVNVKGFILIEQNYRLLATNEERKGSKNCMTIAAFENALLTQIVRLYI